MCVGACVLCSPGRVLYSLGLLLWCSWIRSARDGLPTCAPANPPSACRGRPPCSTELKLPKGTGTAVDALGSSSLRPLRELESREGVELREDREPRDNPEAPGTRGALVVPAPRDGPPGAVGVKDKPGAVEFNESPGGGVEEGVKGALGPRERPGGRRVDEAGADPGALGPREIEARLQGSPSVGIG